MWAIFNDEGFCDHLDGIESEDEAIAAKDKSEWSDDAQAYVDRECEDHPGEPHAWCEKCNAEDDED